MNLRSYRILATLDAAPLRAAEMMEALVSDGSADAPSIPSFYRLLKLQLDAGNVEIADTLSDGARGRPQHMYRLTSVGRERLRAQAEQLQGLASVVLHRQEVGK